MTRLLIRASRWTRVALVTSALALPAAARAQTAAPPPAPVAAPAAPAGLTAAPPPPVTTASPATVATPVALPDVQELTLGSPGGLNATLYGFVELDMMHDSTQSFGDAVVNNTLARPSTVQGDNPRTQFTVRNSRVGLRITAPTYGWVRTSALLEMDFFGNQPTTVSEDANFTNAAIRMRHYFVKFETPIVDVLAGQYHDLFGWGGNGFYVNTVAFLGVNGEIYHRDPQLRVSHKWTTRPLDIELAGAVVRPAQRDAEWPDLQGGLRFALNGLRGVSGQGAGLPRVAPAGLGFSGLYRRFSVLPFSPQPGNQNTAHGWGAAADLFLPIIPACGNDVSNALSVTAEASTGAGIANEYTGLTGGLAFPTLPNPNMLVPVPVFTPNVDPGLVTYNALDQLETVKWSALVLGAQYHLPIAGGRKLWVSGVYSIMKSNNIVSLTPQEGIPYVFSKAMYFDGNVFWSPTPSSQVGLSVQRQQQTFGDGIEGRNWRGELAVYYYF